MPILSEDDHAFFRDNGYVHLRGLIPREYTDAVIEAVWEFLGMDPDDPEDWYREPHRHGGMVELYQHPALWNNRQHPAIHQAFTEIRGTERLWVSLDRACFKAPRHPKHPEYDHKGFIHWDTDTSKPVTFGVQGVLYLSDTSADQGGFQCVPELFRDFDEWVKTQPVDRHPRVPDLTGYTARPIPGKAGDLVIWNRMLPHGNGHNVSTRPRFAQFITMSPERFDDEEARQHRIQCWKERLGPGGDAFPGDARGWEQKHGQTAELTPLGRKLLGLDRWE